jgi:hypothetical protein
MSSKNSSSNPYQGLTRDQALDMMRELLAQENLNHFHVGLLYNYVVESDLLEGSKYKTALDFFCDTIQEVSRSALSTYGAVARDFNREVCARFGITRLQLLITYKKAAKIELNHDEPGGTFILAPGENGELVPKLFANCSVEDLRKALAHLRSPTEGKPIPEEDRARYDRYRKGVTDRFPKGSPVRVLMRNSEGKGLITFKDIPLSEVDKLVETLLDYLHPVHQIPQVPHVEQRPHVS